jgi:hypothetical protein
MQFGEHWYDRLWDRLETVAEQGDAQAFNELMALRAAFGDSEGQDETERARHAFEAWEASH